MTICSSVWVMFRCTLRGQAICSLVAPTPSAMAATARAGWTQVSPRCSRRSILRCSRSISLDACQVISSRVMCSSIAAASVSCLMWSTWHTQKDLVGASLDNIESCCEKILDNYVSWDIRRLALPCIGAGLGGLDWEDVREVLQDFFRYSDLEVINLS